MSLQQNITAIFSQYGKLRKNCGGRFVLHVHVCRGGWCKSEPCKFSCSYEQCNLCGSGLWFLFLRKPSCFLKSWMSDKHYVQIHDQITKTIWKCGKIEKAASKPKNNKIEENKTIWVRFPHFFCSLHFTRLMKSKRESHQNFLLFGGNCKNCGGVLLQWYYHHLASFGAPPQPGLLRMMV